MGNTNHLVLVPVEDLKQIVSDAVRMALPLQPTKKEFGTLGIKESISRLDELGYKVSASRMYKATFNKELPYKVFGRRVIIEEKDLITWADSRTRVPSSREDMAENILKASAKRKRA